MLRKLSRYHCTLSACTKEPEGRSFLRGAGIRAFLSQNADITDFVILDDEEFEYEKEDLIKHWVRTDPAQGLTDQNVEVASAILQGTLLEREEEYLEP